ncbi:endonuclease III homologue, putative [Plasmodium ovale]|uniref:Endonuclease III homolog n=2 Tax=Plasmodium ovale TaxID=36330 RepID=A0A1A8W0E9_PLAOA|nr:endonuclease III homologue, putative [Plasmodium ovale curtisi]SBS94792.1 endonuclease III homologue, putative [Plasmodium ovale curtisi]SCP05116.1 endonuclease III homologue, putative [Plasmodium ovale]
MEKQSKYFNKSLAKKIQIKYEDGLNSSPSSVSRVQAQNAEAQSNHLQNRDTQKSYEQNGCTWKSGVNDVRVKKEKTEEGGKSGDISLLAGKVELEQSWEEKEDKKGQIEKQHSDKVHTVKQPNKRRKKNDYGADRKTFEGERMYKQRDGYDGINGQMGIIKGAQEKSENNEELKKEHFLLTYNKIKEMRKEIVAPVDKYGCHMLGERTGDLKTYRFQTLISCLLSSRTKDEVTATVMDKLKKHGLTVENILHTSEEELRKMIYGVGFYNVKAKQILQICRILKEKYNSDIPNSYDELIKLPGIGEKIAQLVLQIALNKHEGIAVDIHVHRIANRLNWVYTKNELSTQVKLKNYVQKELWSELNTLLVGFGQVICKGKKPNCEKCTLTNDCQYYKDSLVRKVKQKKGNEDN